jgi:hypothetical protein
MFNLGQMSYYVEDATKYGTQAATLLYNIRHWVKVKARYRKDYHEGKIWVYYSIKEMSGLFQQFTIKQVEKGIDKLIKNNALLVGNFNKLKFDRTRWFALHDQDEYLDAWKILIPDKVINDEMYIKNNDCTISLKEEMHLPESDHSISLKEEISFPRKRKSHFPERGNGVPRKRTTIPDIKLPNINTDIKLPNINLETSEVTKEVTSCKNDAQRIIPELFNSGDEDSNNLIAKLSSKTQEAIISLYEDPIFIRREFIKMATWIRENSKKAPKANYSKFILGWLERGWEGYRKGIPPKRMSQIELNQQHMINMENPYAKRDNIVSVDGNII